MRPRRLFALGSLWLLCSACTEFPSIPSTACGNAVIERGQEDCDSFPLNAGSSCRPPGSPFECHLDCTPRDSGRPLCPDGWGCDADFVCRQPSGDFGEPSQPLDTGAWSLAAGDFDGDGRDDVMSSEPPDSIGATRAKFLYFDQQGALAEQRTFPKLMISPTIAKYPGDELSDLTFTEGQIGVMLGRRDRTWVPETFTAYRIDDVKARTVGVYDQRVETVAPFLPVFSYSLGPGPQTGSGFFVVDLKTGRLSERAHIDGSVTDLVGDLLSGNVLEDKLASPCFEPVYAMRGATHFTIVNTCQADPDQGGVKWRDPFEQTEIALDPPAAIDAGPQYTDLNGDGHLDVLIGAAGRPYVSYGDGFSLAPAVPYRLDLSNGEQISADIPMPLAAADVTGDGAPDFVFPDHLLLSYRSGQASPAYSDQVRNRLAAPATDARIADLNGNGTLDIVTASRGSINLEFYGGTAGPNVTEMIVPTSAPTQTLSVGDFDGDLVNDLAVLEAPRVGESKSTVKIAYGAAFGRLADPVAVAQLAQPEQLSGFESDGVSSLVVSSQVVIDGVPSGALTILSGTADRVPFAPFALSEFIANGSVQDAIGVSCAVGDFTGAGLGDVLALAFFSPEPKSSDVVRPSFWIVPGIREMGSSPRQLDLVLDPRLSPFEFLDNNSDFVADIASASANLGGDARSEGIFAMPAGPMRRQCGVVTLGVANATEVVEGKRRPAFLPEARDSVILDEPCLDPAIVPVDADGDGNVDLALLTGQASAKDRKLFVLWNDGTGGFSSSALTLISNPEDSPQAFSVLPAVAGGLPEFVYVTSERLQLVRMIGNVRQATSAVTVYDALVGGTGITVADVNGDRVSDLVVAESGKLRVLKAGLKLQ